MILRRTLPVLSGLLFILNSCATLGDAPENAPAPQEANTPAPKTADDAKNETTPVADIPENTPSLAAPAKNDDAQVKKLMDAIYQIESNFLALNCPEVVSQKIKYDQLTTSLGVIGENAPPLVQIGFRYCDSYLNQDDVDKQNDAAKTINEFKNDNKVLNEFGLMQSLNVAGQSGFPDSGPPLTVVPHSIDEVEKTARQLMNDDYPEKALSLIDAVPEEKMTPKLQKMRRDASNQVVTKMRYQVRTLFTKALGQKGSDRKDTLNQCRDILQKIIDDFPTYSDMGSVEKTLKQVNREIDRT